MTDRVSQFMASVNPKNIYSDLRAGWTVKVHQKIKEGEKTRTQAFEGIIISRKHGSEAGATITVRRVTGGYGTEKTFPLILPTITKIEVLRKSKVRRSKLYYLRDKSQREIRRKTKLQMATPAKEKAVTVSPEDSQ